MSSGSYFSILNLDNIKKAKKGSEYSHKEHLLKRVPTWNLDRLKQKLIFYLSNNQRENLKDYLIHNFVFDSKRDLLIILY